MSRIKSRTSAKSWLARVKSIHDLGNWFYLPVHFEQWDEKRDDRAMRNWKATLDRSLPKACASPAHFGSAMHDSWIVGITRTESELTVRLNSIDAWFFANEYARFLGVEAIERHWPVDLVLQRPVYVRSARYDPTGSLRYADLRRLGSDDQFLYDWFFEQDGRLQWIAEIASRRRESGRLSPSLFLMVDCHGATARDMRQSTLASAYGQAAGRIWMNAFESRTYLWTREAIQSFFRKQADELGLGLADLQAQASLAAGTDA